MKNITVSVTDDLYRQARICAAQRDTTVTELVRSFLLNLGNGPGRRDRTIMSDLAAYEDSEIAREFCKHLAEEDGVNEEIRTPSTPPPL